MRMVSEQKERGTEREKEKKRNGMCIKCGRLTQTTRIPFRYFMQTPKVRITPITKPTTNSRSTNTFLVPTRTFWIVWSILVTVTFRWWPRSILFSFLSSCRRSCPINLMMMMRFGWIWFEVREKRTLMSEKKMYEIFIERKNRKNCRERRKRAKLMPVSYSWIDISLTH